MSIAGVQQNSPESDKRTNRQDNEDEPSKVPPRQRMYRASTYCKRSGFGHDLMKNRIDLNSLLITNLSLNVESETAEYKNNS